MRRQVYLAGLLHPLDLIAHLRSAPLEIELHDRDRWRALMGPSGGCSVAWGGGGSKDSKDGKGVK